PDDRGMLARLRAAVDDGTTGAALQNIVQTLVGSGAGMPDGTGMAGGPAWALGGDRLATRPRGVPADHPRLELMRHRRLVVRRSHGEPDWLDTPDVVEQVRSDWREVRPLVAWLVAHAGGSTRPHTTR
ncbi:MAG: DUF2461 family protein, partial [Dermatophilaceae bacterium]